MNHVGERAQKHHLAFLPRTVWEKVCATSHSSKGWTAKAKSILNATVNYIATAEYKYIMYGFQNTSEKRLTSKC